MGRHQPGAIDSILLSRLLSRESRAHSVGSIAWLTTVTQSPEGILEIATGKLPLADGSLIIRYPVPRPWAPALVYLVSQPPARKIPVVRLCVNTRHRVQGGNDHGMNHEHRYVPQTGHETAHSAPWCPVVPLGDPTPRPSLLRACMEAFAAHCEIDLRDTVTGSWWTDPPKGEEVTSWMPQL